ncbi:MAG TPA: cupredoxin family copper-binding protein [Candidatus Aquilonibacter sp.]
MKPRIISVLAAALLVGLPVAAPAAPATVTVHIKNFKFVPAALAVPAGSSVTFVNDDQEPHTVTATDKSFDSEGLDASQTWTHAFAKAGSFGYFCEMHPYMHGTISVKAPQ